MSTCIDTTNRYKVNTGWTDVILGKVEYCATKIYPCLDCINMPYGKNQECKLSTAQVVYCKTNNHCFKKKNPDCAIYIDVTEKKKFIKDDEFEV
jgi:hypothetical protein